MKILMMSNTYTPILGGLEKSVQSFSAEFRKRGHEVRIVAPEFKGKSEDEEYITRLPAIKEFGSTVFSVQIPIPGLLEKLVRDFKPDLVHAHHPFLVGDLALRLCRQYRIPLVFTYHTMFEQYTAYFGLDNEAIQEFVVKLAVGYSNMADQVIVPSESVGKILKERGVKTPMAVVPTGVDVGRFSKGDGNSVRKKFEIPKDHFVVGHVGRLSAEKNLIFLAEAVAQFIKRNEKTHFLVAGKGDAQKDLEKIFDLAGVSKRLHLAGVMKDQDLVDTYHAADVFAFASTSETQGMVITEAMASGLPVVAIDAPGVREVVLDRKNGRLLNKEDVSKFCAALEWCLSQNEKQWERIKDRAKKTADEFSMKNSTEKALRVYDVVKFTSEDPEQEPGEEWPDFFERFKAEWEMLLNIGRAAGKAIAKVITDERSPAFEMESGYREKIEELISKWELVIEEEARNTNDKDSLMKKKLTWELEFRKLLQEASETCKRLDERIKISENDLRKHLSDAEKVAGD